MFARVVEYIPKMQRKDDLIKMVRQEVLPILKKQPGFLELLPLIPENENDKFLTVGLWADKEQAEKFMKSEAFMKIEQKLKVFLDTPTSYTIKNFHVETSVCEHLVEALTAAA